MTARTLACLVDRVARCAPSSAALLVPEQGLALSYGELRSATRKFAAGLYAFGARAGNLVVADLPNTGENLLLQIAASRAGVAVATVKDAEALSALVAAISAQGGRVCGAITTDASSTLARAGASLPLGVVTAGPALEKLMGAPEEGAPAEHEREAPEGKPLGYWSSLKALTHEEALALGSACAEELALQPTDRVCVAISLYHAFGIGSACASALHSGAAIVLPAVGGIRGCGVPEQRAALTLRVLAAQQCTVLFADSHTLKALESPELVRAREELDLSHLRAGVVKVGSGADFLEATITFAGVPLRTLGKR
ncbi:hypothetical protein T492DRAFT_1061702 [Pavlovales sp. CCMP2436]|nr:hypothetical protein T492DRAFT_1061702 [Pavlovales sp. CCMP2436]